MTGGYQALREHAAWIDLSGRGKIRVTGEDRARLLHAMTTNDVQGLKPGEDRYAFFLNAQGRILADVNILCLEDHFLLDTEPETRQKIYEHLDRYIIADDVTLEDATDRLATISIEGPESARVIEKLEPSPSVIVRHLNTTGSGGFFLIGPAEEIKSRVRGLPEASSDDARIVRIEHGKPRYGEEITERYLVQETDQLQAIHFSKGCYLGQEIVERVRSRAQIHRVLRKLEIDSATPPEPGTKLKSGDADAAEVATAVFSPALQKTVALAYVRTPFAEPGTQFDSTTRVV